MNIPKAIELLQRDLDDSGSVDISDLNKAQALGIEALKLVIQGRNPDIHPIYIERLQGETKD
jgi:hypothetical protein